jgi:hypothetical protein
MITSLTTYLYLLQKYAQNHCISFPILRIYMISYTKQRGTGGKECAGSYILNGSINLEVYKSVFITRTECV